MEEGKILIYIYDILLNFTKGVPFEFFEWGDEDDVEHMKRMPLYKVNRVILDDLIYGDIFVDTSFLEEIRNKTEFYQQGSMDTILYAALFTDGNLAVAIRFNGKGQSILKSRMLLDEEEEVLEVSNDLREISLPYYCKSKQTCSTCTRFEMEMKQFLKQEFEEAILKEDGNKLAYFYEECFEKKCLNQEQASKELLESLKSLHSFHKKLYFLLKSSYQLGVQKEKNML